MCSPTNEWLATITRVDVSGEANREFIIRMKIVKINNLGLNLVSISGIIFFQEMLS